jgi:hypothetical protein
LLTCTNACAGERLESIRRSLADSIDRVQPFVLPNPVRSLRAQSSPPARHQSGRSAPARVHPGSALTAARRTRPPGPRSSNESGGRAGPERPQPVRPLSPVHHRYSQLWARENEVALIRKFRLRGVGPVSASRHGGRALIPELIPVAREIVFADLEQVKDVANNTLHESPIREARS